MRAGCFQPKPALVIIIIKFILFTSCHLRERQVCHTCKGTVLNGTVVGTFCTSSAGRIEGRCCVQNHNSSEIEHVIGLDLSNCSLTHMDDLRGASTAVIIDLSINPLVNISDSVFQGCVALDHIVLPSNLACPGGNASWEKVEVMEGNIVCHGQENMCNETGQMSLNCPDNSLCAPNGPGFFMCSCADGYHGYKCLRAGGFPFIRVFVPLGASTILISILLWVTQRRKAKSV